MVNTNERHTTCHKLAIQKHHLQNVLWDRHCSLLVHTMVCTQHYLLVKITTNVQCLYIHSTKKLISNIQGCEGSCNRQLRARESAYVIVKVRKYIISIRRRQCLTYKSAHGIGLIVTKCRSYWLRIGRCSRGCVL